jgi:hypothetical protein
VQNAAQHAASYTAHPGSQMQQAGLEYTCLIQECTCSLGHTCSNLESTCSNH